MTHRPGHRCATNHQGSNAMNELFSQSVTADGRPHAHALLGLINNTKHMSSGKTTQALVSGGQGVIKVPN